jgi:hypothetical protein
LSATSDGNIVFNTTGATGIGTAAGLPDNVNASWANNTITISGTPTVSGIFPYTIPLTGGCGTASATGTITVAENNTAGNPSTMPTLCINTLLSPTITIATTGATGIGSATDFPEGVTATWANDIITISGTPTESGYFNYSIPLTGGCGTVNATGTITVSPMLIPIFTGIVPEYPAGAPIPPLPLLSDNGISGTWAPEINNMATTEYEFTPTAGQCATNAYITITITVGINDPLSNQLQIFPNPTNDELFIKSNLKIEKVELYSTLGTLLISENNFKEKISVSALPTGIYFLRVYTDKGLVVSKVVKE